MRALIVICFLLFFVGGCAYVLSTTKDVPFYGKAGERWGKKHMKADLKPGDIDEAFVEELLDRRGLDYFSVNTDMRDAFVKGYRKGFQDKTADLVLEPNFKAAAARMGK